MRRQTLRRASIEVIVYRETTVGLEEIEVTVHCTPGDPGDYWQPPEPPEFEFDVAPGVELTDSEVEWAEEIAWEEWNQQ